MVLFPAAQVIYFTLNNRPTLKDGSKNPLSDVRVRQALNYATDKQAMIQVLTYGIGTPEQTFMPMSTPLSYSKGPLYPYDPARPKKLLARGRLGPWLRNHPVHHRRQRGRCRASFSAATDVGAARGAAEDRADGNRPRGLPATTPPTTRCCTSLWTNDINDPNEITSLFCYYPTIQNRHSG